MPRTVDKLPEKPKPEYHGFRSLRFIMYEIVDGEKLVYQTSEFIGVLQEQRRKLKQNMKTMPIGHEWVKTTKTT